MAHWFHRNPLKATTAHNFDYKLDKSSDTVKKLCNDLKLSRNRLLDLIRDPNNGKDTIEIAFAAYLGLLYGLIWEIETTEQQNKRVGRPDPSKLRSIFVFKWTHTLLGRMTHTSADAVYEAANMSINVGLWFMKHAAMIAAKDGAAMVEAKEVHSMLRQAAGIFTFVQTEFLPQISEPPPLGSDLDSRVINAYINQCTAEAQEVTVARAVELKHNSSLISALANETSKLFQDAANTLRPFKQDLPQLWIKYLELKSSFYLAYAFNYCGDNLLGQDKCGEAIRALQEAQKYLNKAKTLCQAYSKSQQHATVKPDQHSVFKKLTITIQMTLDKCNRENGLIYHDTVPGEVPPLDTKATFGLVSPIDFQMPPANNSWTQATYQVLIGAKHGKVDKESSLPPVKEESIQNSKTEPKTESGCSIQ